MYSAVTKDMLNSNVDKASVFEGNDRMNSSRNANFESPDEILHAQYITCTRNELVTTRLLSGLLQLMQVHCISSNGSEQDAAAF